MADTTVSKTVASNGVRVRVPPRPPINKTMEKLKLVQYVHFSKDEIEWHETEIGYQGVLGESTVWVAGSEMSVSMLTISAGYDKVVIYEPMPLEDSPLSKWVRGFKKNVLGREPAPFPDSVKNAIKTKQMINEILSSARKQCQSRFNDPAYEYKLYKRVWNKMTGGDK